jgi:PTH1 family peptidyl-tRNA hydrolase
LKSIIDSLGGSKEFKRMRIGIGHPGNSKLVNKYVVQKGSVTERKERLNAIENGIEVIECIVKDNWDLALNTLHSK